MDKCSTCQEPIMWAVTTSGKRMPLDPVPVRNGNVILEGVGMAPNGDELPRAHVLSKGDVPFGDPPRYVPHFATCPQADAHRQLSVAARRTDPDTSHLAAKRARRGASQGRDVALRAHFMHPHGLTDFELGAMCKSAQTSIGVRRGELVLAGEIEATSERRLSPSNSPCIVWRITAAGRVRGRTLGRLDSALSL